MTAWAARAREEAALFNPGFCSVVLHEAARGYCAVRTGGMDYPLAFLVLPLVLHRPTRSAFPRDTRTSMAVWLDGNPDVRVGFVDRARAMAPIVREALIFAANHGLLRIESAHLVPDRALHRKTTFKREHATDEVSACLVRGEFVGKWMASAGKAATIFALWGVRP